MGILFAALWVFCFVAVAVHLSSLALIVYRSRGCDPHPPQGGMPSVSILRPLCGIENSVTETIESTFLLSFPKYEAVFCVSSSDDPVIELIKRLQSKYPNIESRLLVGNDNICSNPKLNNLAKGWRAALYGWIAMADSNVLLPPDYIDSMFARWTADTGLVSSPPVGTQPEGFWAELECAYLNTYEARWQLLVDQIGFGFAQGKNMLCRRDLIDAAGGFAALGTEAAEDAAATKIIRRAGFRVRLSRMPFAQPLGRRNLLEVWHRQLRWARLRRASFPLAFLPEVLSGSLFPLCAAMLLALHVGASLAWVLALAGIWYGTELALARVVSWPCSVRSILTYILRDLSLPVLWICAWIGNGFVWRGNAMVATSGARGAVKAGSWSDFVFGSRAE